MSRPDPVLPSSASVRIGPWRHRPLIFALVSALLGASVALTAQRGGGGGGAGANPIATLKGVSVPPVPDLARYVASSDALVVLGKALFWDVQVGSDGRTACASCHFHAGADHRLTNQIAAPAASTARVTPNTTLVTGDFPFHAFSNPANRNSGLIRSRREVVGSAGVVHRGFVDVVDGSAFEAGADALPDGSFFVGGLKVRQVTSRNTPSVINAVFNLRNFWDGRAQDVFNGRSPFGPADARAAVLVTTAGGLQPEVVRLTASSLASQAVGPPLNAAEMSFAGRAWPHVGRKLLALTPLATQAVAVDDSVLGPYASPDGPGLRPSLTYAGLIRAAFQPDFWNSPAVLDLDGRTLADEGEPAGPGEFNQMAVNFGLFFGLAVQAYESTLVSDDTPVDRFLAGDTAALSAVQQQGLNEFRAGGSQCTQCHHGPELTAAGVNAAGNADRNDPRAVGFFRLGVSSLAEDPGASGTDDAGRPLFPAAPGDRAAGAFKAPGLRNVEFTGPYFHTGGAATLEQVLEFYARNGDIPDGGNLGPGIGNIQLGQQDRAQLLEFLKALSDDRVRFERAPFDHPALCVAVGYDEVTPGVLTPETSPDGSRASAADRWALVPAVGRQGNPVPLQTFAEQLAGIGADGSRAHTLQQRCGP